EALDLTQLALAAGEDVAALAREPDRVQEAADAGLLGIEHEVALAVVLARSLARRRGSSHAHEDRALRAARVELVGGGHELPARPARGGELRGALAQARRRERLLARLSVPSESGDRGLW